MLPTGLALQAYSKLDFHHLDQDEIQLEREFSTLPEKEQKQKLRKKGILKGYLHLKQAFKREHTFR